MLSICIPHYNYLNPALFNALLKQCLKLNITFEMLIIDDASLESNKIYLSSFNHEQIRIIYLEKNIGRAAIRNLLANTAHYNWLLFLDADAEILDDNFINNYLSNLNGDVIIGGRKYPHQKPENYFLLHWNYGTYIETKAKHSFNSSNFLIKKEVFKKLQFDENLKDYGYEDVLFGIMLKQMNFKILNIDNPIIHIDLKSNEQFIADTESAVINLIKLKSLYPKLDLAQHISLLKHYQKLNKFKMTSILSSFNGLILKYFKKRLLKKDGKNKNQLFQLYKLCYFHQLFQKS